MASVTEDAGGNNRNHERKECQAYTAYIRVDQIIKKLF